MQFCDGFLPFAEPLKGQLILFSSLSSLTVISNLASAYVRSDGREG